MVLLSSGVAALLRTVGPHEGGPSETPLDGALVHDERILDVVSVVGEDRDAEVLTGGPVAVSHELHGLRLDHGDLGVLHEVAPGVGPDAVVGRGDTQCLLTHSRTHGDTGCGVVLGVGDDTGRHSEDDHGVDLHVGVLLLHLAGHGELLVAPPAPEHGVAVLAGVHPVGVGGRERVVAAGAPAGGVVRVDEDERVLLLLGVEPLDDSLAEHVPPSDLAVADPLDVLPGDVEPSLVDDEQGPPETSLVAVDDDLAHLLVVADVDLVGDETAPPAGPDLVDELPGVGVDTDEVPVDEDTDSRSGLDGLDVELPEHPLDVGLGESLGDVDDERGVLHETAVLTLGCLGGAEPSPLGGVKVTGLEVGLAPGQGGRDPPEVGHCGQVGRPVEQLGHTGASADPVTGGERVEQLVGEEVGADGGGDVDVALLPSPVPLELVLEVLHEAAEAGPEEVLHEVAGQLEPLVGVVVLVVLLPLAERELEDGAGDTSEEDRLLHAVRLGVTEVGQQRAVEDGLDLLRPVLLRLAGGEVPLQEENGVLLGVVTVGCVGLLVERGLDVGVHDVGHRVVGDDRLEDLGVGLHSEGLHQGDEGDGTGCDGDGDHDHAVLLLLDECEGAVSVLLGEDLGNFDCRAVFLVVLDHDPVGCEVLERDQDPLGTSDDEVPSGLPGVLLLPDELRGVLGVGEGVLHVPLQDLPVEVAAVGLDHHGEVPDVDPFLALGDVLLDAVLVDLEVDVHGGHVVEVPEPGLHGGQLVAVSVGLHDLGLVDAYGGLGLDVDVPVLVPLPADVDLDVPAVGALGVELDDTAVGVIGGDPDVVHDPLHPAVVALGCGEEIVEGRDVVVDDVVLCEVQFD